MNILGHILAGHYETDAKGRPLVPRKTPGDVPATIVAVDGPGDFPIVAFGSNYTVQYNEKGEMRLQYCHDGHLDAHYRDLNDLKLPEMIKVETWAVVGPNFSGVLALDSEEEALADAEEGEVVVKLTGQRYPGNGVNPFPDYEACMDFGLVSDEPWEFTCDDLSGEEQGADVTPSPSFPNDTKFGVPSYGFWPFK